MQARHEAHDEESVPYLGEDGHAQHLPTHSRLSLQGRGLGYSQAFRASMMF
jgi:hypothetical protein